MTLEQVVTEACEAADVQAAAGGGDEALAYLSAGLTEIAATTRSAARAARAAGRKRRADGAVALDSGAREEVEHGQARRRCRSSRSWPRAASAWSRFPRRAGAGDAGADRGASPAAGAGAARPSRASASCWSAPSATGTLAIGSGGTHHLDDGRVEGEDPLAPFGPNAADHLRRTDGFPHCPDMMVNSTYWPEDEEVAAFEELVGSHGGMGGPQSFPFVLHPAELPWPREPVVGAERVHRVLRAWLAGARPRLPTRSARATRPASSTRTSTSGASSAS